MNKDFEILRKYTGKDTIGRILFEIIKDRYKLYDNEIKKHRI